MRTALSFFAASLILSTGSAAAQSGRPIVRVVGTGGTIGSAGDYWRGNTTRVPIEELLRIPGLDSVATVETEQFLNVASSAIGPPRWLQLSRRITELFRSRSDLRGIVVTHGTDTMEETAYFLDLTVGDERPVVVTGAMRPANMAGADGPANLMNAVRSAADPATRGRGTVVLMNDRLFAARDVTKTNSTRVETFQAPERGPIAIVDPEGLLYRSRSAGRRTAPFDVTGVSELPRVDIVYAYAGADSIPVDALISAGAKGIVVASVGRGHAPEVQERALRRALQRGVIVVVSTRTGAGAVPVASTGDFIGAGELNPQKARVLLALALTRTSDPSQVRKIFAEHQ